jgi:periplasmic copper chaperone A
MLHSRILAVALLLATATAAEAQSPAIQVDHAWARATPGGAKTAAVYLKLVNNGATDDHLVFMSTPVAGKAELHSMTMNNGVMHMQPVATLEVKPATTTVLKPGGYHVMLTELKAPLVAGQHFQLSLTFEKAGTIETTVSIEKVGATAPAEMPGMKDMPGMKM